MYLRAFSLNIRKNTLKLMIKKVLNILQISPQRMHRSLWNLEFKQTRQHARIHWRLSSTKQTKRNKCTKPYIESSCCLKNSLCFVHLGIQTWRKHAHAHLVAKKHAHGRRFIKTQTCMQEYASARKVLSMFELLNGCTFCTNLWAFIP